MVYFPILLGGIEPPQLAYQASTLPLSYRVIYFYTAFVVQLDRILDCGSKDEGSNPSKGKKISSYISDKKVMFFGRICFSSNRLGHRIFNAKIGVQAP